MEGFIKRYFRLMIPVTVSLLFAYILMQFNAYYFSDIQSITKSEMADPYAEYKGLTYIVYQGFFGTFFKGDFSYNPVLWTMKYELFGSLLVFAVLFLVGRLKNRTWLYLILAFALFNTYYLGFVLGLWLCDLYHHGLSKVNQRFFYPAIILGIYFGYRKNSRH